MATVNVTDENFDTEVLKSAKPIVVDFWAEWCGPCRMIAPILDELSDEFQEKAVVGKVNVDLESDISTKYGITSIPTLLFFKDGKVQNQIMGAVSKADIEKALNDIID